MILSLAGYDDIRTHSRFNFSRMTRIKTKNFGLYNGDLQTQGMLRHIAWFCMKCIVLEENGIIWYLHDIA